MTRDQMYSALRLLLVVTAYVVVVVGLVYGVGAVCCNPNSPLTVPQNLSFQF